MSTRCIFLVAIYLVLNAVIISPRANLDVPVRFLMLALSTAMLLIGASGRKAEAAERKAQEGQ